MRQGMDVKELAEELKREAASQIDYVRKQSDLRMELRPESSPRLETMVDMETSKESHLDKLLSLVNLDQHPAERNNTIDADTKLVPQLILGETGGFPLRNVAHGQIANRLKIPKPYYDRMKEEAPQLLVDSINTWLEKSEGDLRMIRTMDGEVRAYLSNKYRRIDNLPLMLCVLQTALDLDCKIASCSLTETNMYIKFVSEKLKADVRTDAAPDKTDIVQAALLVKNSEVGKGSVAIEPMIIRIVCWNGAVMSTAIRRRHVGRALSSDEDIENLLSDETKRKDDEAFFAKVEDVVRGSLNEDLFGLNVEALRQSAKREIISPVEATVDVLSKRHRLVDAERDQFLQSLIEGKDLTQWGMGNALTLMSSGVKSYDRATELEGIGGSVFQMNDSEWAALMKTSN